MKILFATLAGGSLTAVAPAFAQEVAPPSASPDRNFSGVYVGGSFGYTAQPSGTDRSIVFDRDLDRTFGDTSPPAPGPTHSNPDALG